MHHRCGHGWKSDVHRNTLLGEIALWIIISWLFTTTGCVSQGAYERVKIEIEELSQSLMMAREEITVLRQSVASWEAANKAEENKREALQVVIQREVELLPIMRQQAYERIVSLQAQVATLTNQSRALAKHLATAKRESDALHVLVSQYRQEIEAARVSQQFLPATTTPAIFDTMDLTQQEPTAQESIPPPMTLPQEMAQQIPVDPTEQPGSRAPSSLPTQPTEGSWIDLIVKWLASFWNWIVGFFG
ncbi:MAG: hypothetical protein NNA18_07785 [Nitrospira sp.]|nr:hypothetical protein [Nitrospira sp.]